MDKEALKTLLEADPEAWPVRMALVEELVRTGDVDAAKKYVREAPDHIAVPAGFSQRIHSLFTVGWPDPGDEAEPETQADEVPEKESAGKIVSLRLVEHEPVSGQAESTGKGEKMAAILVAVIAHLLLAVSLIYTKWIEPQISPPVISVTHAASTEEPSLKSESLNRSRESSSPQISSQPVISITNFSDFALPDTFDTIGDIPLMSFDESGNGIGMASSGSGDVAYSGAIPPAMRSRCSLKERIHRLDRSGGDTRAEAAVVKGLDYLISKQNNVTGAIGNYYPVAMTGLSLLAFLGHCETPDSVAYGDGVVLASLYLIEQAIKRRGLMASGAKGNHIAYEHAIATYALAEMYTMTKAGGKVIPRLEPVLRKAAQIITESQKGKGGWSYYKGGEEDMSVSGWNIQALKALYNTGMDLPTVAESLDRAVLEYLPSIQDGGGAFKYRPRDREGKRTLTGAALLGMQIWGQMGSEEYNKGFRFLHAAYRDPFVDEGYYALYYNTQVYFLHGGEPWKRYNEKFLSKLFRAQLPDGSWPNVGRHGRGDKKIMNTAWAILMLEVYYRYLPTTDKIGDLKRGG